MPLPLVVWGPCWLALLQQVTSFDTDSKMTVTKLATVNLTFIEVLLIRSLMLIALQGDMHFGAKCQFLRGDVWVSVEAWTSRRMTLGTMLKITLN